MKRAHQLIRPGFQQDDGVFARSVAVCSAFSSTTDSPFDGSAGRREARRITLVCGVPKLGAALLRKDRAIAGLKSDELFSLDHTQALYRHRHHLCLCDHTHRDYGR